MTSQKPNSGVRPAERGTGRMALRVSLAALIISAAALPISVDLRDINVTANSSWAKGGNGGGNGGGGGNGNGNGGGNGNGTGGGNANGHGNHGDASANAGGESSNGDGDGGEAGSGASLRGSLNAAHASPQALAHANQNSRVGQIAAYSNAIQSNDVDTAAAALAEASNKDDGIVESVIHSVNALLGIDDSPVGDPTTEPTVTVHSLEPAVAAQISHADPGE